MANKRYNPQCNLIRTFFLSILLSPSLHIALLVVFIIYAFKIACKSFLPPFMLHHLIKFSSHWSTMGTLFDLYRYHKQTFSTCSAVLCAQRLTVDFYLESLSCTSLLDLLKKFWWCKFLRSLHNQGKGDTFEGFQREIPAACFLKQDLFTQCLKTRLMLKFEWIPSPICLQCCIIDWKKTISD